MKKENGSLSEKALQTKVAAACGVSFSSVRRIINEHNKKSGTSSPKFSTPRKKRPRKNLKTTFDDFDLSLIRKTIHEFHLSEGERPTLKGILRVLKDKIDFKGSVWCVRKVVKKLGFRWKKTESNRKLLVEKSDIRNLRLNYLVNVDRYRKEKRQIVYMDETYFHSTTTTEKTWTDSTVGGLKKSVSKGSRVIVLHAGGEEGFVANGLLMFKSGLKKGDYHGDMNYDNYEKWIKEQLIPNLKPNSVLVIDNAPYHNKQVNPAPTSSWKKQDMQKWLTDNGIPYCESMLKPQLYSLIKLKKPQLKIYKIDAILAQHGHSVLRLPPYHPDLNPIELIWATVKDYIKQKNVKLCLQTVLQLAAEKFAQITPEDWKKRCEHVKKIEEDYLNREHVIDQATERFVIHVDDSSDSDSDNDSVASEENMSGIEELD